MLLGPIQTVDNHRQTNYNAAKLHYMLRAVIDFQENVIRKDPLEKGSAPGSSGFAVERVELKVSQVLKARKAKTVNRED